MSSKFGHNGPAAFEADAEYLASVVGRLLDLEAKRDGVIQQQRGAMLEIGGVYWPNGWRGRDGRRLPEPMARFLSKVRFSDDTDCWDWTGSISNSGYGLFAFDGGYKLAHRFSLGMTRGLEGGDLVVDHLCRNKLCVNPAHLQEVTQSTNVLRGDGPRMAAERIESITHCKHGHPLSGANVYFNPKGYRSCRKCGSQRKLAWQRLSRNRK